MTQGFSEAIQRFTSLLAHEGWPGNIAWVTHEHVLSFPGNKTALFRPSAPGISASAERQFEEARERGLPVELYAVGFFNSVTYACVRPIHELAQGEAMFLEHNVKVSVASSPPRLFLVRARFWWSLLRLRHSAWLKSRDRVLRMNGRAHR